MGPRDGPVRNADAERTVVLQLRYLINIVLFMDSIRKTFRVETTTF